MLGREDVLRQQRLLGGEARQAGVARSPGRLVAAGARGARAAAAPVTCPWAASQPGKTRVVAVALSTKRRGAGGPANAPSTTATSRV